MFSQGPLKYTSAPIFLRRLYVEGLKRRFFSRHEQETKKELKPHRIEDENGFLNVESEKLYEMLNNVFTYPRYVHKWRHRF